MGKERDTYGRVVSPKNASSWQTEVEHLRDHAVRHLRLWLDGVTLLVDGRLDSERVQNGSDHEEQRGLGEVAPRADSGYICERIYM